MKISIPALIILLATLFSPSLRAENYHISVQPVLPADEIKSAYRPLANYLSEVTGHQFEVKTYRNFLTYWIKMKKDKNLDFVLDAAHFTDFRFQRKKFKPIVNLPDTVSFTVVTSEDNFIFEMEELISKKIATMPSPGMGAVRLNQMFPNPVRLPFYIQVNNSVDAVKRVLDGSVDAAIIPSPLVNNYDNLNSVISTDPTPHMALSASPNVPDDIVKKVRDALVSASNTKEGQEMLKVLNIEKFVATDTATYDGYAELLDGVFGY